MASTPTLSPLNLSDRAKTTGMLETHDEDTTQDDDSLSIITDFGKNRIDDDSLSIITDFGRNRQSWEDRGKKNTPNGLDPECFSPKVTKTNTPKNGLNPENLESFSPTVTKIRPAKITPARRNSTYRRRKTPKLSRSRSKSFAGNGRLLRAHSVGGGGIGNINNSDQLKEGFPSAISDKIVTRILEKVKETSGGIPQCITFTLGGTDNINVYAKTMGQIFTLLGAKLANNSVDEIELIPLDVLGRPRIDVIASCSGSFRDLHMNQMILIDKAIKMVAEADEAEEMNFVRKHALEQASELDIPLREAATRVFSNAAGAYSSNIAALIKSNDWKSEEQLQKQFIERKGHAFDFDRPDSMEYQGETFKAAMKKCDVTVQNVDLSEIISVTDVPHYYDSDPTKVIQNLREDNKKPLSLWANALKNKDREVLTLAETLRLDALKKIMSPDYYEKVLETPEGVRDISNCLRNVLGWAVTAGDVDTFVFEISYNVFIEDKKMLERLRQNDRDSYQTLITTFLKASEHGYWETAKQNPTNLRRLLVNEWRNSGALTASRHQSSPPPKSHESFSIKSRRSSSSVAVLSKSTSRLSMSTPSKGGIFGSSWRRFRKTPSDQDLSSSSHGELSTVPTWRRGFQPNREDISRSAHGSALSRSIHS